MIMDLNKCSSIKNNQCQLISITNANEHQQQQQQHTTPNIEYLRFIRNTFN